MASSDYLIDAALVGDKELDFRPTLDESWSLADGVEFCRIAEPILIKLGYHIALGGSVLISGRSNKDVDVFIYPHKNIRTKHKSKILKSLETIGIKVIRKFDFEGYDKKLIYHTEYNGQRVDIFFVK